MTTGTEANSGVGKGRTRRWLAAGFLGVFCLAVVLALVLVVVTVPRETSFGGRSLTEWLPETTAVVAPGRVTAPRTLAANAALEAMAPDCFPYMLAMMRANDKRWRELFDALLTKQKWLKFRPRPSELTRWEAAQGFAALGPKAAPAVPSLRALLRDLDTTGPAAYALGFIGTEEAMQALEHALESREVAIRQTMVMQISRSFGRNGHRLVRALLVRLEDSDAQVRQYAARSLGQIGSNPTLSVPALAARLKDPNTEVRQAAALALIEWGCGVLPAKPALEEALRDNDPAYAEAVRRVLRVISYCEGR